MDIIVQVAPGHAVREVAEQLQKLGAVVERELAITGIIGARVPRLLIDQIGKISGIAFLRQAGGVQLPPFDENFPQ